MDISTAARKAAFAFGSMLLTLVSIVALSQPAGATTILPDFTTFRSPTRGVFLIANGHFYGVPNPETLTTCLGGWGRVQTYSEAVVDDIIRTYPAASAPAACRVNYANATTLSAPSDPKVYVVFNGRKYWVTSGDSISGCLGGWGAIRHISNAELAWTNDFYPYAGTWSCPPPPPLSYPNMTTLQAPGTGVVVINNGSRFAVPNPVVLERCYSGQARVRQISTAEWNRMWAQFNDGSYAVDCAPQVGVPEQRAVAWARTQIGSTSWNGWCEKFVEQAFGRTGQYASALSQANSQTSRGRMHSGDRNVPVGALAFYGAHSSNGGYGHVMISIGSGQFITSGYNSNGVYITTLAGIAGAPYLGWSYANSGWSR